MRFLSDGYTQSNENNTKDNDSQNCNLDSMRTINTKAISLVELDDSFETIGLKRLHKTVAAGDG